MTGKRPRKDLPSAKEWSFVSVPSSEHRILYDYELSREAVLRENKSELEKAVCRLRHESGDLSFDAAADRGLFLFCSGVGFWVPTFYREWPDQPYLSIPQPERTRRANRFTTSDDNEEVKRRFFFEPRPGDRTVTLSIPPYMHWDEAKPLWDSLRKELFADYKRKGGGRSASPERLRDRLFALAALRLQRYELSRREIIAALKEEKSPRFSSEKSLDKQLRNAREELEERRSLLCFAIQDYIAITLPFALISPEAVLSEGYRQLQEEKAKAEKHLP